ncbi:hypothetical protein GYMLUDRAFT_39659 [Collybiopsis luxurians FD-317 M1]|nr:hypothetical protein GYMLUDRAFT_39659 [Collybiopsis luxurians FD-317 M1]
MGNDLHTGPLPSFMTAGLQGNALQAYKTCLVFERYADGDDIQVLYARILGYLMLHAPSSFSSEEISKTISACGKDFDELSQLGKTFLDFLIWPFKRSKQTYTPVSSDSVNRSSLEEIRLGANGALNVPVDHHDAKIQALVRDHYRCVVTGRYDAEAAEIPDLLDHDDLLRAGVSYTHCAYIVPDSNYFNRDVHPDAEDFAKSVSLVLRCLLIKVDVIDKLSGPQIHSLYNVMTMEPNILEWFYRLEMWFETTPTPHRYKIQTKNSFMRVPKEIITLKPSQANLHFPLPDPDLLALHATAAKVALCSGANRYIDKILQDMEEYGVLDTDGGEGSLDFLVHAILRSSSRKR